MTHTRPKDNPRIANQKVTHHVLVVYISDKQDSKALFTVLLLLLWSCSELEMKGFTQIEGQSTQGSDK